MTTTIRSYAATRSQLETLADGTYPVVVALASGYTWSDSHEDLADITGELSGSGYARVTLSGVAFNVVDGKGYFDSSDPTFASFTGTFDRIIVASDQGADSASPLMFCVECSSTTVTADTLTITVPVGGWAVTQTGGPAVSVAGVEFDSTGDVDAESLAGALESFIDTAALTVTDVDWVIAADAVDGTGNAFTLIRPEPTAAASGDIPAGWEDAEAPTYTESALAAVITAAYSGTIDVFVPELSQCYTVTSDGTNLTFSAITTGDVVRSASPGSFSFVGNDFSVGAEHVTYPGTGLNEGVGFQNVHTVLHNMEGSLDRWIFVSAVADANVNTAAMLAASWDYGALDFAGAATFCYVWLRNQTTTAQNGFWKVTDAGVATQIPHPDIFDPPGQGARVTLKHDGDADDGRTWVFLSDDPEDRQRANGETDLAQTGRWVEVPGTGGGGGGGDITTDTAWAAKGDLIAATGNNSASVVTVGADDTFLVADSAQTNGVKWANASTARTALGLGAAALYGPEVLGGQDEGTAATSSSATSLLDSTISLSGLNAGDAIDITASMRHLNNSGSSRSHTIVVKIGATTVATLTSPSMASSASYRFAVLRATIRVEGASDQNTLVTHTITGLTTAADGSASTENLSSGAALDITGAVGAGGSQEIQLLQLSVTRSRA